MRVLDAKFLTSAAGLNALPDYGLKEIAVAGKSNVGKSSFINFLTNNGKLAKTSGTPGKTRLLNYFSLKTDEAGEIILVDLPGYGYAEVAEEEKAKWGTLIEGYFRHGRADGGRGRLAHALLLVDIRHKPAQNDIQAAAFFYHFNIPFTVIATKSDKLGANDKRKQVKAIADTFGLGTGNILTCSSHKKEGLEAILERIKSVTSY